MAGLDLSLDYNNIDNVWLIYEWKSRFVEKLIAFKNDLCQRLSNGVSDNFDKYSKAKVTRLDSQL